MSSLSSMVLFRSIIYRAIFSPLQTHLLDSLCDAAAGTLGTVFLLCHMAPWQAFPGMGVGGAGELEEEGNLLPLSTTLSLPSWVRQRWFTSVAASGFTLQFPNTPQPHCAPSRPAPARPFFPILIIFTSSLFSFGLRNGNCLLQLPPLWILCVLFFPSFSSATPS